MALEEKDYTIDNETELEEKKVEEKKDETKDVAQDELPTPDVRVAGSDAAAGFVSPTPSFPSDINATYGENQPTIILDNPGIVPDIFLETVDIDSYVEGNFSYLSEKEKTELKKKFGMYASVIKDMFYKFIDRSVNSNFPPKEQVDYFCNLKEVLFNHTMTVDELLAGKKTSDINLGVSLEPKEATYSQRDGFVIPNKNNDPVFGDSADTSKGMNNPVM